jgi:hypothetical protein
MLTEFRKTELSTASSNKGFEVKVEFGGGVLYKDENYNVRISSEWLVSPHRMLIYLSSFRTIERCRREEVFSNLRRAVEFLGHPVELWPDDNYQKYFSSL